MIQIYFHNNFDNNCHNYLFLCLHIHIYTHSLATLLGTPLLVPGWTHFCLQNCFNSSWHSFNRWLKHSSEILVHIDMIASHGCCRFIGCTSMMWISRSPHPKAALLDWDLVTVEAIWVKWTHYPVQETSLRWFELCDTVHYPAGSSIRRCAHCSHKGMDMASNNTQVGCGV